MFVWAQQSNDDTKENVHKLNVTYVFEIAVFSLSLIILFMTWSQHFRRQRVYDEHRSRTRDNSTCMHTKKHNQCINTRFSKLCT